ncbi:glycosyltransferase [bacterium]|nr:glycosyltransferase [candidate division CSSED10-310 bacterium]
MKVAIIHDWLTGMRGGERVLEVLCKVFPEAPIFSLFYHAGTVSREIESHPIIQSRLRRFPLSRQHYRYLLPLFPGAIESFDLSGFDVIVSTSHAVAKGAIPGRNAISICYCHTPMRYIWDQYDSYFNTPETSPVVRFLMPFFRDYLRNWDVSTQSRVDYFIANSRFVARRIQSLYQRNSVVIPAPVDCSFYTPGSDPIEDFYLIVNALAPYKRVDLAIDAFNKNERRLLIIGGGTEMNRLKNQAKSNIEFLGRLSDDAVREHYRRCRALIFPGVEDFGLVPLEVQACGRPVIAYARGGALETVVEGVSGHFFHEQSADSLNAAIGAFESMVFSSAIIRERSLEFDTLEIERRLRNYFGDIFRERGIRPLEWAKNAVSC